MEQQITDMIIKNYKDIKDYIEDVERIKKTFTENDLEGLESMYSIITDKEDEEERQKLIFINNEIGIGWGEDLLGLGKDVWYKIEEQYFDRKAKLLEKYNLLEEQ